MTQTFGYDGIMPTMTSQCIHPIWLRVCRLMLVEFGNLFGDDRCLPRPSIPRLAVEIDRFQGRCHRRDSWLWLIQRNPRSLRIRWCIWGRVRLCNGRAHLDNRRVRLVIGVSVWVIWVSVLVIGGSLYVSSMPDRTTNSKGNTSYYFRCSLF